MKFVNYLWIVSHLCLVVQDAQAELIGSIIDSLNPFSSSKGIVSTILDELNPFRDEEVIVKPTPTKFVLLEDAIFQLCKQFEASLYGQGHGNFVTSPLIMANLIGQLLIATNGDIHAYFAHLLFLDDPRKTNNLIELSENNLYHSAFHWKLQRATKIVRQGAMIKHTFFYDRDATISMYFKKFMVDYYYTERQASELKIYDQDYSTSVSGASWINQFHFGSLWNASLKHVRTQQTFSVSSFIKVKTNYLQGTINNTILIENPKYTLLAIPLSQPDVFMYVLLPNENPYQIETFLDSFKDFEMLKNLNKDWAGKLRNVYLTIPDVFYFSSEVDMLKPIVKDLTRRGATWANNITLNRAANKLQLKELNSELILAINENVGIIDGGYMDDATQCEIRSPFLYVIMNSATKMVLFWGSVSDPSKMTPIA